MDKEENESLGKKMISQLLKKYADDMGLLLEQSKSMFTGPEYELIGKMEEGF